MLKRSAQRALSRATRESSTLYLSSRASYEKESAAIRFDSRSTLFETTSDWKASPRAQGMLTYADQTECVAFEVRRVGNEEQRSHHGPRRLDRN
jgi:hypothetical protein